MPERHDLVTIDDIAARLDMSFQAASNLAIGRDGGGHKLKFPRPYSGRGQEALWIWQEVASWYEQTAPKMKSRRRNAMTYRRPRWSQGRRTA